MTEDLHLVALRDAGPAALSILKRNIADGYQMVLLGTDREIAAAARRGVSTAVHARLPKAGEGAAIRRSLGHLWGEGRSIVAWGCSAVAAAQALVPTGPGAVMDWSSDSLTEFSPDLRRVCVDAHARPTPIVEGGDRDCLRKKLGIAPGTTAVLLVGEPCAYVDCHGATTAVVRASLAGLDACLIAAPTVTGIEQAQRLANAAGLRHVLRISELALDAGTCVSAIDVGIHTSAAFGGASLLSAHWLWDMGCPTVLEETASAFAVSKYAGEGAANLIRTFARRDCNAAALHLIELARSQRGMATADS